MQTRELVQLEDYFAPWDRWFENRVYPTSDGISSFFTDITERKRNEQELRRQRDILDRTSRLAKVGGWEFEVSTLEGSWTDETARIQDMEPSPSASVRRRDSTSSKGRRARPSSRRCGRRSRRANPTNWNWR